MFLNNILVSSLSLVSFGYVYNILVRNNVTKRNSQMIVSSIHSIYTASISVLYLLKYISEDSFISLFSFSTGFVIVDMYITYNIASKIWRQMILHHTLMLLGHIPFIMVHFNKPLIMDYSWFIAMNYLSEIPTIFLNKSWFLHNNNKEDSVYFTISSWMTFLLYIPTRIINHTYLSGYLLLYRPDIKPLTILQLSLTCLNYYWFSKILLKIREPFINKTTTKEV